MRTTLVLCLIGLVSASMVVGENLIIPSVRIPPHARKFNSSLVNQEIVTLGARMANPQLATLFNNCFPNTLDTTVVKATFNDTFIITGDIDAMWLRDSTNQVMPYVPFVAKEIEILTRSNAVPQSVGEEAVSSPQLVMLFTGLVRRQLRSVLIDSYANSYNIDANGHGHQTDFRVPKMQPALFEGKYELDSLCAVIKLSYNAWKSLEGGQGSNMSNPYKLFDPSAELKAHNFGHQSTVDLWIEAMDKILLTMQNQTMSTKAQDDHFPYRFYRFPRDIYPLQPMNFTGMVRSAFRPSDDETWYDFLVPSNAMAHVELGHMVEIFNHLLHSPAVSSSAKHKIQSSNMVARAEHLRVGIQAGIERFALWNVTEGFSYEVDGFGYRNNMDDANVPSLLSLPFLGYVSNQSSVLAKAQYAATRSWVLSPSNPWYFSGTAGAGIGSPHTGQNHIWPMSIMVRTMTSQSDSEIRVQLATLIRSANTTGFMHESFNKDNVLDFTRSWFAWANTLFGEMVLRLADQHPSIIFGS